MNSLRHLTFFCLFLLFALAAQILHLGLDKTPLDTPNDLHETLPSQEALKFLSLTYEALVADYYWLKTINEFGDVQKHRYGYPNLEPLTRSVLTLDPYFETGYTFAGTSLTVEQMDPSVSVELLEQGMKYRPDLWRIPFLLGFNAYYFLNDYEKAAKAMARAAQIPGASPVAAPLATRLAAQAGQPELGIQMIDALLQDVADAKLKREYKERRNLLLIELHLSWLNQALQQYAKKSKTCPASFDQVIAADILRGLPEEPLGGLYTISADCKAISTSEFEQLRVHGKTQTDYEKQRQRKHKRL